MAGPDELRPEAQGVAPPEELKSAEALAGEAKEARRQEISGLVGHVRDELRSRTIIDTRRASALITLKPGQVLASSVTFEDEHPPWAKEIPEAGTLARDTSDENTVEWLKITAPVFVYADGNVRVLPDQVTGTDPRDARKRPIKITPEQVNRGVARIVADSANYIGKWRSHTGKGGDDPKKNPKLYYDGKEATASEEVQSETIVSLLKEVGQSFSFEGGRRDTIPKGPQHADERLRVIVALKKFEEAIKAFKTRYPRGLARIVENIQNARIPRIGERRRGDRDVVGFGFITEDKSDLRLRMFIREHEVEASLFDQNEVIEKLHELEIGQGAVTARNFGRSVAGGARRVWGWMRKPKGQGEQSE